MSDYMGAAVEALEQRDEYWRRREVKRQMAKESRKRNRG